MNPKLTSEQWSYIAYILHETTYGTPMRDDQFGSQWEGSDGAHKVTVAQEIMRVIDRA